MPQDMPLAELGSRLAVDESAVAAVYAQLAPTVLAYLRRVVPPDDAEDVLQRTFLDVWRSRNEYDPTRSLAGWVIGIAKHRAIDQLRRRVPQPVDVAAETGLELHQSVLDDDLAERFVRSAEIREALTRISAEQRQVLVLAYFDDLTLPQVANWVGAPLGTVKARAARGLRALARVLSEESV